MNKKLMAVAVAGALAAPALVMAQSSTVNVYGKITYEYGIVDQGSGQRSTDYADSPGGTEIGFRGEEKLGGGLSAWFQCNTSADVRAMDQIGLCSRNSAIGFKGGWGNLHFGRWDTPMKRALNVGTVGAEETGILGMSFLPFGGSGAGDVSGTGADAGVNRQRWKRREAALSYYESPSFNGFQILAAFSSGNAGADLNAADGLSNAKPRVQSFAGTYQSGPLGIGFAYERHNDMGAAVAGGQDFDDRAWGLSAAYTFGGNIKVGGTYLAPKFETGVGASTKRKSYTIGVDWAIAGPHSVAAQYAKVSDCKGNGAAITSANTNGGCAAAGPDTGGDAWSLAYSYAFSKRTRVKLGYVRVDNDTNTRSYRIGNSNALTRNGENVDGYAFHISHTF